MTPLLLALTMFFQISRRYYTINSTSPIFSHITNNLGSSGGERFFKKIQHEGPLKLKKEVQQSKTCQLFSLDNIF
jgi:hypothetical protein